MELFNINNRILLIISISSILLSSSLLASSAHGDDVVVSHLKPHSLPARLPRMVVPSLEKMCKKTTYPALCTSTILPSLHHRQLSPALALQLEIKACLTRTQAALAVFKKISCASTSSPVLKHLQGNLESAVEHLKVSTAAIAKHDVGTLKTRLSAVITDFSSCKDSVAQIQGGFKLGAAFKVKQAVILHKLATNCLALSTLL